MHDDLATAIRRFDDLTREAYELEEQLRARLRASGWTEVNGIEGWEPPEYVLCEDDALFGMHRYDFRRALELEAVAPEGWHAAWAAFATEAPFGEVVGAACPPRPGQMPPATLDDLTDDERSLAASIAEARDRMAAHTAQVIAERERPVRERRLP